MNPQNKILSHFTSSDSVKTKDFYFYSISFYETFKVNKIKKITQLMFRIFFYIHNYLTSGHEHVQFEQKAEKMYPNAIWLYIYI